MLSSGAPRTHKEENRGVASCSSCKSKCKRNQLHHWVSWCLRPLVTADGWRVKHQLAWSWQIAKQIMSSVVMDHFMEHTMVVGYAHIFLHVKHQSQNNLLLSGRCMHYYEQVKRTWRMSGDRHHTVCHLHHQQPCKVLCGAWPGFSMLEVLYHWWGCCKSINLAHTHVHRWVKFKNQTCHPL